MTRAFLDAMRRSVLGCRQELDHMDRKGVQEGQEALAAEIAACQVAEDIYRAEQARMERIIAGRLRMELGREDFAEALESGDYSRIA